MGDRERRSGRKKEECVDCGLFTWIKENQRCDSCEPPAGINKDKEEPRKEKEDKAAGEGSTCGKCKVEVKKKDNGILCDICKIWYHAGCGKCSLNLYRVLKEEADQLWFCPECKPGVVQACADVKRLREENKVIKQEMQELRMKYEDLTDNIRQLKEKREEREETIVDRAVKEAVNRMEKLLEESEKQREEKEDRERRRRNVIVFNVPESTQEQGKDREEEDKGMCDQVFGDTLRVEGYRIEKVVRLGKREEGKTRPTLVKLEDEVSKWQIISKAKNLKNEQDEILKQVVISLDLTQQQRDQNYGLRQELKRRRERRKMYYKTRKNCA